MGHGAFWVNRRGFIAGRNSLAGSYAFQDDSAIVTQTANSGH